MKKQRKYNPGYLNQLKQLRTIWQFYFLAGVIGYAIAIWQLFFAAIAPKGFSPTAIRNFDMLAFIIAIGLTILIFQIKRQYFLPRFINKWLEFVLKTNPAQTDEELTARLFKLWRQKFYVIWGAGVGIIYIGLVVFWITFSHHINFHIYFAIGLFSLIINYPRKEMFAELPWQIANAKKDAGLSFSVPGR
jgi:hypothetical protein